MRTQHGERDPLYVTQFDTDKSESIYSFKSKVKMEHDTNIEEEYFELIEADEIVKGEKVLLMENENELNASLEDMEGTKVKLELSMEQIELKKMLRVRYKTMRLKLNQKVVTIMFARSVLVRFL